MPSTSHARCKNCGQSRHKIARYNVCQTCWEEIKPSIRDQWRQIKERRRLRREVDSYLKTHGNHTSQEVAVVAVAESTNGVADVWDTLRQGVPADEAERLALIERVREVGVPKEGTPERALYMRLFVRRNPYNEQRDQLIARLYMDSDVPVTDILHALRVDANELSRVRRRMSLGTREDMKPWRPRAHISENEELWVDDNFEPRFRHEATGLTRRLWDPEPEPTPEPEPEPAAAEDPSLATLREATERYQAEQEPVLEVQEPKVPQKRTYRLRHLTKEQRAEIVGAYQDPTIPIPEIQSTYDLTNSQLYKLLQEEGVHTRRSQGPPPPTPEPEPAQHPAHQLHLGQAAGAQAEPPRHLSIVPTASVHERIWALQFTVTREVELPAPSLDEALRRARDEFGLDINVTRIEQR